jgi:hypothetical protein
MVPPVLATMIFYCLAFKWEFDCACIFGVFYEDISSRPDGIRSSTSLNVPTASRSLHPPQVSRKMVLPLLCHQY